MLYLRKCTNGLNNNLQATFVAHFTSNSKAGTMNKIPNKLQAMNPEKLRDFVNWLHGQVEHLSNAINDAHAGKNFGREAQYEGMRDAFMRCLNKLTQE